MKNTLTLFLLTLLSLTFACTPSTEAQQEVTKEEIVQQKPAPVHQVLSKAAFKTTLSEEDIALVDVRTPTEFAAGHIEGAININVMDPNFPVNIVSKTDTSKQVMIYCRSGKRAARAANVMKDLGYPVIYDLKGGYLAWVKE